MMNTDLLLEIQRPKNHKDDSCRTFYWNASQYVCLRRNGDCYTVKSPEECHYFKNGCTFHKEKKHAKTTDEQQWSKAVEVEDTSLSCLS